MTQSQFRQLPWKYAAGQLVLIIVGVLAALAANSWREERGERRREAGYRADLSRDLQTTLNMVDRSIVADSQHIARTRLMLTYLRNSDNAPQDSIRQWRGVAWPGFATVTGTVRALLETGELRLLSGPMRHSLTAYATDLQYAEREIDRAIAELIVAQRLVREREEAHTRWGRLDSIAGRAYALDGPRMRADPQLRAAYLSALSWQQFYQGRLLDFRIVVLGFRKAIEAEGQESPPASSGTR